MKKKLRIPSRVVWWSLIGLAAAAVVLAAALGIPYYRAARAPIPSTW